MVDLWEPIDIYTQEDADSNLRKARENVGGFGTENKDFQIVKMDLNEAASNFPEGYFDYIHLDAGHSYQHVRNDLEVWWSKVRVGGMMSGDDYKNGFVKEAGYR